MKDKESRERLFGISNGYIKSQAMYIAAKLGIADMLVAGPKTAEELATASNVHAKSLHRILQTLASEGIFTELEDGRFELSPMAEWLRSDTPGSLRGWAIMRGEPASHSAPMDFAWCE